MAQNLIAALIDKPAQRHWVGPDNLLNDDTCGLMIVSRHTSDATRANHFWHALAHNPHLDGFFFTVG